jgi:hypothetical protein
MVGGQDNDGIAWHQPCDHNLQTQPFLIYELRALMVRYTIYWHLLISFVRRHHKQQDMRHDGDKVATINNIDTWYSTTFTNTW